MDQQLQLLYNYLFEIESHVIYTIISVRAGQLNHILHPIK